MHDSRTGASGASFGAWQGTLKHAQQNIANSVGRTPPNLEKNTTCHQGTLGAASVRWETTGLETHLPQQKTKPKDSQLFAKTHRESKLGTMREETLSWVMLAQ